MNDIRARFGHLLENRDPVSQAREIAAARRAEWGCALEELAGIEDLSAYFIPADGIVFKSIAQLTTLDRVPALGDNNQVTQDRFDNIGKFTVNGGALAVVDPTGTLFIAPAEINVGHGLFLPLSEALKLSGYREGSMNVPFSNQEIPLGRADQDFTVKTLPMDWTLFRVVNEALGRPASLELFDELTARLKDPHPPSPS